MSDTPYIMTCHFEDDAKVIYHAKYIVLSILIWSIIIIYENNGNETLRQRKNVGHHCVPLQVVSMPWVFGIDNIISPMKRGCCFNTRIKFKYWLFDSGYGPLGFNIRRLFPSDWSQRQHWLFAIRITPNPLTFLYKAYLFTKHVICSSYLLLFHCL